MPTLKLCLDSLPDLSFALHLSQVVTHVTSDLSFAWLSAHVCLLYRYVDTGAVMERDLGERAGLGFVVCASMCMCARTFGRFL